jgi:phosphoglycolate phosphatase
LPRFALLIFDLDGTLIDTSEDLTTAVNATLAEWSRAPLGVDEVCSYVGDGARKLVERVLGDGGSAQVDAALARFAHHYEAHLLDRTRPYPGIPELLDALAPWPKALASNKPVAFVRPILRALGWEPRFDPILGGDSLPQKKPHPAVVAAACQAHGVEPAEALVVGDGAQDVQAARAAGARSCAVTWGFRSRALLEGAGADWMIDRPDELLRIVAP